MSAPSALVSASSCRRTSATTDSAVRAVTGPGASNVAVVDRGDRLHLARRRGQERLVRVEQFVERARALGRARDLDHDRAGDRGEDVLVERRRQQLAVLDAEDRARRRLEHAAVGGDEQRLVEPALAGEPAREHVRAVRQRLDAVEHPGRRVGHRRQPDVLGRLHHRLGQEQPPAAAGDHDPQQLVVGPGAGLREQAPRVGPDRLEVERQPEVRGRALEPSQVALERERPPVVDADHLEHSVAADQALVGRGDRRLGGEHDRSVERGERAGGASLHRRSATTPPRAARRPPRRPPCPAPTPTRAPSGTRGRR